MSHRLTPPELLGRATMVLTAPVATAHVEDNVDPAVGTIVLKARGKAVAPGEPLVELHYRDSARLATAVEMTRSISHLFWLNAPEEESRNLGNHWQGVVIRWEWIMEIQRAELGRLSAGFHGGSHSSVVAYRHRPGAHGSRPDSVQPGKRHWSARPSGSRRCILHRVSSMAACSVNLLGHGWRRVVKDSGWKWVVEMWVDCFFGGGGFRDSWSWTSLGERHR